MKPHVSDFARGRRIVRILVGLAVALGLCALMFTQENSQQQMFLILASCACVVSVIVVARFMCICPHCGKRIVSGVLVLKVCPKCKHSLITGEKMKNSRK